MSFLESFSNKATLPKKSELPQPIKEGFLSKQAAGVMKKWKKRYFYLTEDTLFYFKDETTHEAKGAVPLIECAVSKGNEQTKKKHTFVLSSPSLKKEVFLLANSSEETEEWMKKIMNTQSKQQANPGLL